MYSKAEASRLNQEFWTVFGQYMALQPSSEGERINWINYKTGIKNLFFKMEVDQKFARISIHINHSDLATQESLYEKLSGYKTILQSIIKEEWEWELQTADQYGKIFSQIYGTLPNVNIHNKSDWPAIISFLKPRIIALDEF